MSADSPRRSSGNASRGVTTVPAIVPPQVVNDRSILDSAIGFINEVTLAHQPPLDAKDTITWARFETTSDISDPRYGEDWELEGNVAPPLLLILGYGLGVQVWAIPANGEAVEVLSWRHGIVSALKVLPTPLSSVAEGDNRRADELNDVFGEKRPLIALVDGSSSSGSQPQFCAVNFVSLKSGAQLKTIKFKNPVVDILANRSSVVITFHERIAVFDARTLEDRLTITTCYPSPGINPNPAALGPRWLAYAENKLLHTKRSGGGCDGDGVASYTATVLNASKSLVKGLRELGEQVAAGLTGSSGNATNSKNTSFDSGYGLDTKQGGVVTIIDIKNSVNDCSSTSGGAPSSIQAAGIDLIVAHFIAHSEALVAMEFDNSGMLLVTADRRGHDFHVFRIQPNPVDSSLAAVHHLYILHRGDTSAKVQNITLTLDTRWVAVSTLRGTTHVFPITPYGGSMGVRTHTSLHVVNKLSRFHRSAGLSNEGRSNSPISHSESTTFSQSLQPYNNSTLPPFPRPTVVMPLAQLRQPFALGSPPGSASLSGVKSAAGVAGSGSQRQRLSSLSDDNGKPLSVCAIFAKSRSWLLDPPNVTREAPHRMQRKAVDSLFVMAGHGALIQYDLDTKLASNVVKEKICDETPVELEVEAKAQWNLGRRKEGSQEIMPPLLPDNWLIKNRNSGILNDSSRQYDDTDDRSESWLSQVEIITHAGPHRRLWMGPQFVFKTYNTPSGSNLTHVDIEAVEIGTTKSGSVTSSEKFEHSNPLNMPLTAAGRSSAVPVLIESGSYSSIEQSPKLMDRFRHDNLDSDYSVAHGDSRLKEDLADAMRESPSATASAKDTGGPVFESAGSTDNVAFYDALTAEDDQAHVHAHSASAAALASVLPNIHSYDNSSSYEHLESKTMTKNSIEKIVNPLGTVTTISSCLSDVKTDILDEVVSQLAKEDTIIHENCDESLFRPVIAIFCDEKSLLQNEEEARINSEQYQPPEIMSSKLVVPVIVKEMDEELSKREREKTTVSNFKTKLPNSKLKEQNKLEDMTIRNKKSKDSRKIKTDGENITADMKGVETNTEPLKISVLTPDTQTILNTESSSNKKGTEYSKSISAFGKVSREMEAVQKIKAKNEISIQAKNSKKLQEPNEGMPTHLGVSRKIIKTKNQIGKDSSVNVEKTETKVKANLETKSALRNKQVVGEKTNEAANTPEDIECEKLSSAINEIDEKDFPKTNSDSNIVLPTCISNKSKTAPNEKLNKIQDSIKNNKFGSIQGLNEQKKYSSKDKSQCFEVHSNDEVKTLRNSKNESKIQQISSKKANINNSEKRRDEKESEKSKEELLENDHCINENKKLKNENSEVAKQTSQSSVAHESKAEDKEVKKTSNCEENHSVLFKSTEESSDVYPGSIESAEETFSAQGIKLIKPNCEFKKLQNESYNKDGEDNENLKKTAAKYSGKIIESGEHGKDFSNMKQNNLSEAEVKCMYTEEAWGTNNVELPDIKANSKSFGIQSRTSNLDLTLRKKEGKGSEGNNEFHMKKDNVREDKKNFKCGTIGNEFVKNNSKLYRKTNKVAQESNSLDSVWEKLSGADMIHKNLNKSKCSATESYFLESEYKIVTSDELITVTPRSADFDIETKDELLTAIPKTSDFDIETNLYDGFEESYSLKSHKKKTSDEELPVISGPADFDIKTDFQESLVLKKLDQLPRFPDLEPLNLITMKNEGSVSRDVSLITFESPIADNPALQHEDCNESLFRPVIATFCDENNLLQNGKERIKNCEQCKPPEIMSSKLVPITAGEMDGELSQREREKTSNWKTKLPKSKLKEQQNIEDITFLNKKSKYGGKIKTDGENISADMQGVETNTKKLKITSLLPDTQTKMHTEASCDKKETGYSKPISAFRKVSREMEAVQKMKTKNVITIQGKPSKKLQEPTDLGVSRQIIKTKNQIGKDDNVNVEKTEAKVNIVKAKLETKYSLRNKEDVGEKTNETAKTTDVVESEKSRFHINKIDEKDVPKTNSDPNIILTTHISNKTATNEELNKIKDSIQNKFGSTQSLNEQKKYSSKDKSQCFEVHSNDEVKTLRNSKNESKIQQISSKKANINNSEKRRDEKESEKSKEELLENDHSINENKKLKNENSEVAKQTSQSSVAHESKAEDKEVKKTSNCEENHSVLFKSTEESSDVYPGSIESAEETFSAQGIKLIKPNCEFKKLQNESYNKDGEDNENLKKTAAKYSGKIIESGEHGKDFSNLKQNNLSEAEVKCMYTEEACGTNNVELPDIKANSKSFGIQSRTSNLDLTLRKKEGKGSEGNNEFHMKKDNVREDKKKLKCGTIGNEFVKNNSKLYRKTNKVAQESNSLDSVWEKLSGADMINKNLNKSKCSATESYLLESEHKIMASEDLLTVFPRSADFEIEGNFDKSSDFEPLKLVTTKNEGSVSRDVSLITFESPTIENQTLQREISLALRGRILHFENEQMEKTDVSPTFSSHPSSSASEETSLAGCKCVTENNEMVMSLEQSSRNIKMTTTNNEKFFSSTNSSGSEEIVKTEEKKISKKQKRKRQQHQLKEFQKEEINDEELRPLIALTESQVYPQTNNSPAIQLLLYSTTTDSDGPLPTTTSDDNVFSVPVQGTLNTHKIKTKKLEHKINLIAAIEAATSSSAEESGVEIGANTANDTGESLVSESNIISTSSLLIPIASTSHTAVGVMKKKTKRHSQFCTVGNRESIDDMSNENHVSKEFDVKNSNSAISKALNQSFMLLRKHKSTFNQDKNLPSKSSSSKHQVIEATNSTCQSVKEYCDQQQLKYLKNIEIGNCFDNDAPSPHVDIDFIDDQFSTRCSGNTSLLSYEVAPLTTTTPAIISNGAIDTNIMHFTPSIAGSLSSERLCSANNRLPIISSSDNNCDIPSSSINYVKYDDF